MSISRALENDAVLIGAALVGVYLLSTGTGQQLVQKIAASLGGTAVDAADNVIAGTVKGIGEAVGIPNTNPQLCQIAINSGDVWAASLYCPLGDFLAFKQTYVPPDP
jgi:hypothetical protein